MELKNDPLLHHVAKRIQHGTLELAVECFNVLGLSVSHRFDKSRSVMIAQAGLDCNIQLIEVPDEPLESSKKINSHVAFISNDPKAIVEKIGDWAKAKKVKFEHGGWNEREFWFDLPEIFTDWVMEVMHASILEE